MGEKRLSIQKSRKPSLFTKGKTLKGNLLLVVLLSNLIVSQVA